MMNLDGLNQDERIEVLRLANDLIDFIDPRTHYNALLFWLRTSNGIQVICMPLPLVRARGDA